MALVQTQFTLADTTGSVETVTINAANATIQGVFYGTDNAGNPKSINPSANGKSFQFRVLNGQVLLQVTFDLNGFPSDTIIIGQAGDANPLDTFIATPGSLLWDPTIEGT